MPEKYLTESKFNDFVENTFEDFVENKFNNFVINTFEPFRDEVRTKFITLEAKIDKQGDDFATILTDMMTKIDRRFEENEQNIMRHMSALSEDFQHKIMALFEHPRLAAIIHG